MAKSKKLNNIEKLAIQGLVLQGNDALMIAKEIDRPRSMVENYLVELRDSLAAIEDNKSPAPAKKGKTKKVDPPKRPTAKDFMINKTSGKGVNGVSIMTREASQRIDDTRGKIPAKKSLKEYLHKIVE